MCLVCLPLCKEESSSPVSLQLRRGIYAYMRYSCLCLCLVTVCMGSMLANFHIILCKGCVCVESVIVVNSSMIEFMNAEPLPLWIWLGNQTS